MKAAELARMLEEVSPGTIPYNLAVLNTTPRCNRKRDGISLQGSIELVLTFDLATSTTALLDAHHQARHRRPEKPRKHLRDRG